jgi:hypothetical protein
MAYTTFHIEVDGEARPVTFTDEAFHRYQEHLSGSMDREIRALSDFEYGPEFYLRRTNRLGVLAALLYEALASDDEDRLEACVMWLVDRFPEIAGVQVDGTDVQYLWEADEDGEPLFDRPEYLH